MKQPPEHMERLDVTPMLCAIRKDFHEKPNDLGGAEGNLCCWHARQTGFATLLLIKLELHQLPHHPQVKFAHI
jgi:hypothetical protein